MRKIKPATLLELMPSSFSTTNSDAFLRLKCRAPSKTFSDRLFRKEKLALLRFRHAIHDLQQLRFRLLTSFLLVGSRRANDAWILRSIRWRPAGSRTKHDDNEEDSPP